MLQQQREKPTGQAPRSSSVLEIVLGTLHLLVGGGGLGLLLWLSGIIKEGIALGQAWYIVLGELTGIAMTLCTALAGLFLLCRQRSIARSLQWCSTFAALCTIPCVVLIGGWPLNSSDQWILGAFLLSVFWMAWFAWFLKKQESED